MQSYIYKYASSKCKKGVSQDVQSALRLFSTTPNPTTTDQEKPSQATVDPAGTDKASESKDTEAVHADEASDGEDDSAGATQARRENTRWSVMGDR